MTRADAVSELLALHDELITENRLPERLNWWKLRRYQNLSDVLGGEAKAQAAIQRRIHRLPAHSGVAIHALAIAVPALRASLGQRLRGVLPTEDA